MSDTDCGGMEVGVGGLRSQDAVLARYDDVLPSMPARRSQAGPAAGPAFQAGSPGVCDWLVIGSGFVGTVLAQRPARVRDKRVLVVDRRDYVASNTCAHLEEAGILMHRYSPHVFYSNSESVFDHLSQFTAWRPCERRAPRQVDGKLASIPITLDTVNRDHMVCQMLATLRRIEEERPRRSGKIPGVATELPAISGSA